MVQPITVPGSSDVRMDKLPGELRYVQYEHRLEHQYLPAIRALISKDLSEPYSIYVYRYFLCQWSKLCFMVCVVLRPAYGPPYRPSSLPTNCQ